MAENHVVPAPANRWVLAHLHIFKNAGSTVEFVLRRSFGERFATVHGPSDDSVISSAALAAFLTEHPNIAAISSHHLRYPLPEIPGTILFDICFLRNPLRRLWSMYRYFRGIETAGPLAQCARAGGAVAFFDLLLTEHPHLINDVQVNFLANGGVYTRPPNDADLRVAVERMRAISVVGVVEMFDESAVAAEYFLRPTFPALQFDYIAQNVTERTGEDLGPERLARLERLNRLDLELLDAARRETLRRFEMVPDAAGRLAGLRRRCLAAQSVENP